MIERTMGLTCLLTLLLASMAPADVLLVPGDFAQIHDAVQAAAAGDTVLVAAASFSDCTHETEGPGSTPACVIMKSGVTLRGAGPEATIIDAQGLGRGIYLESVASCRIENLQVTGCDAEVEGAGILFRNVPATASVTDVKLTSNLDGGILCDDASSPVLTRLEFTGNEAKQGGSLALKSGSNAQVIDCVITGNQAPTGPGIFVSNSDPIITGCLIQNNTVTSLNGDGGGILVISGSPMISECQILDNTAGFYGGGICFQGNSGGTVSNCLIQGNTATNAEGRGGGIYCGASSPTLTDLVIVENRVTGFFADGGGIACSFSPTPVIQNSTVAYNAIGDAVIGTGTGGGILCEFGANVVIENCILAFSISPPEANAARGIQCVGSSPEIACSNIFGNDGGDANCGSDNGGNFSADPLFCGNVGFEYNLQTNSPCAPGNHPDGASVCAGALIGALPAGCSDIAVYDTPRTDTRLLGNAPNPFNPRTSIFFVLGEPGTATLRIFDLRGRPLRSFTWNELSADRHEVDWDGRDQSGRDLPSGVYLFELEAHGRKQSQRMSLIR